MIIVAGALHVRPEDRDSYLAGCRAVVEQARRTAGCLDFALSADLLDAGRINVLERWRSRAELAAFRGSGPSGDQQAALVSADVAEYEVPDAVSGAAGTAFPRDIGAPATRALAAAGHRELTDLAGLTEAELLAMHGVGPRAVERLRRTMAEHGLSFRR